MIANLDESAALLEANSAGLPNPDSTELLKFQESVAEAVASFPLNKLTQRVDQGLTSMEDYHRLLLMIFHQTFRTPQSLGFAGAMMPERHLLAREYLVRHAEEEQHHWKWVLNDLAATGYRGQDPVQTVPPPSCVAYVALNFFVALQHPVSRLAISAVLEGIGATFSKPYAARIAKQLKLAPGQMQFFLGHSDTDVVHSAELMQVIAQCDLTSGEWAWMKTVAKTAANLYNGMYDAAAQR